VPVVVRRIGEITARIQQAWTLPRNPLGADFHCRVRIRQDDAGALGAIEWQQCDEDATLRASLVKAIRAAAPLPARDDSQNSAWDLTLQFTSFAALTAGPRSRVEPSASMP
jgi:hypothetical protein